MVARKVPLTIEQHREIGPGLFRLNEHHANTFGDLSRHYPKSARGLQRLSQGFQKISRLRSALDSSLANEFPREFDPRTYYPGDSARSGERSQMPVDSNWHRAYGRDLMRIQSYLIGVSGVLDRAYSVKSPVGRKADTVWLTMQGVRAAMDDLLAYRDPTWYSSDVYLSQEKLPGNLFDLEL